MTAKMSCLDSGTMSLTVCGVRRLGARAPSTPLARALESGGNNLRVSDSPFRSSHNPLLFHFSLCRPPPPPRQPLRVTLRFGSVGDVVFFWSSVSEKQWWRIKLWELGLKPRLIPSIFRGINKRKTTYQDVRKNAGGRKVIQVVLLL